MSSLKDTFADDGSAADRINRVIAKNKAALKKTKVRKISLQPMDSVQATRSDEELSDATLKKFRTHDFMNLFLSRLPARVTPIGFDEHSSEHIFKLIIRTFEEHGASKRGVARALTVLAKNIQAQLSLYKLPLTELNLRRISAYREDLAVRMEPFLLPEGSIELLLASDSAENTDYELIINRNTHTTELTLTSLIDGNARTFRFLNNQLEKHIQNQRILKDIYNHDESENA